MVKHPHLYLWLCLSLLFTACQPIQPQSNASLSTPEPPKLFLQSPSSQSERTARDIFTQLAPSIAFVETPAGTGSGVLVEHGYLLSNAHVVWPFDKVRVVFPDGSEYLDAPVFAWDLVADLALIGPIDTNIQPAPLTNNSELEIGSDVYLIGYPAEVEKFPQPTITNGILSRIRRWDAINYSFFQVDATITGGQSGGVLVTQRGDIVGISTFYYDSFGLAGSVTDAIDRLNAMLGNDTGVKLNTRPFPNGKGKSEQRDTLHNKWDVRRYIVQAPPDTEVELSVDGIGRPQLSVTTILGGYIDATKYEGKKEPAELTFTVDENVPYVVEVSQPSTNENEFTLTSSYPLFAYLDPDDEQTLKVGDTVVGNMDVSDDNDYYLVDLKEGEVVKITVDSLSIDPAISIEYETAILKEVTTDDDSGGGIFGSNAQIIYKASKDDTYRFRVENYSYESVGSYFLKIETESAVAEPTKPQFSQSYLSTDYGRMTWYESETNGYTILYPVDWQANVKGVCPTAGVTLCVVGPLGVYMILEEDISKLPKKDRNLDGYLGLLQDTFSSQPSVEIDKVEDFGTLQHLNAAMMSMNVNKGRAVAQRLIYVDQKSKSAFGATFLTSKQNYEQAQGLMWMLFDSFRLWESEDRDKSAVFHLDEGLKFLVEQKYEDAVKEYSRSIELDPGLAEAYMSRAIANNYLDEFGKVFTDVDKAIELDPTNIDYYIQRSSLHWIHNNPRAALAALDQAIKVGTVPNGLYNQRALINVGLKDYRAALADIEKFGELNADISDELPAHILDTRAYIYLKMGEYEKALADYNKVFENDARFPASLLGCGLVYAALEQPDKAKELLEEGLQSIAKFKIEHPDPQLQDLMDMSKKKLDELNRK